MGSKLHKTTELLISQVFYRQSCVENIEIMYIIFIFKSKSYNKHIIVNIQLVFKSKLCFLRFQLALKNCSLRRVAFCYLKASISYVQAAVRAAQAESRK